MILIYLSLKNALVRDIGAFCHLAENKLKCKRQLPHSIISPWPLPGLPEDELQPHLQGEEEVQRLFQDLDAILTSHSIPLLQVSQKPELIQISLSFHPLILLNNSLRPGILPLQYDLLVHAHSPFQLPCEPNL